MATSTAEIKTVPAPIVAATLEEFLASEDGAHTEWANGAVVAMSPISYRHQVVLHFLIRTVGGFVGEKKLGVLVSDPFQARLPGGVSRAPDLMFIAQERRSLLQRAHFNGAPDLVVEIISPGSRTVDRGEKFYEYEAAGVREFWLIDPDRQQVEWYSLGDDKLFHAQNTDGAFRSRVLRGLWIEEAWLWQDEVPSEIEILKLWGVI